MRNSNHVLIAVLTVVCACAAPTDSESDTILDDLVLEEDDDVDTTEGEADGDSTSTGETDSTGEADSTGETDTSSDETGCHDLEEVPPPSYCDPLKQTCDEGYACIRNNLDKYVCVYVETYGLEGDGCGPQGSCSPGLTCHAGAPNCQNTYCCTPFCDFDCPVCEAPGASCIAFIGPVTPGFEHVGYCGDENWEP